MAPLGAPRALLALLLVLSALAAGCTSPEAGPQDTTTPGDPAEALQDNRTALEGTVADGVGQPIPDALVTLQGGLGQETTGPDGSFAFEELAPNKEYILTASKEGYLPVSKQALLVEDKVTRVTFALALVPPQETYLATQDWTGLLSCQAMAKAANDEHGGGGGVNEEVQCGDADPNQERRSQFGLDPDVQGLLVEVRWAERTPAAHNMHVAVEGVGFGDSDPLLGESHGASIIQVAIARGVLEKYFTDGGVIAVEVGIEGSVAGEEAGSDVGLAFQQPFEVKVTAAYGGDMPQGFSAFEAE